MAGSSSVVEVELGVEPLEFVPESKVELRCLSLKAARREAIERFEVEFIRALLEKAGGNVTRAARLAEVSRQVIHKLIARHRL